MQAKPNFIVSLSDASGGLAQVGGKGASLARLAAAGLPVPHGFHITTAAYRRFVAENGLQPHILAVMATGAATRLIHTGQVITVDGSAGTVTLKA